MCPDDDKMLYNVVYKKLLDLGDFIGIEGELFKTQVGEISIRVDKFTLLSKSLKPLPLPKTDVEGNVHDAFTDPEMRYRQRYADLVVNPHVKVFVKRTKLLTLWETISMIMDVEVETPVLQPIGRCSC